MRYTLRNVVTNDEHKWLVELHNDPDVLKNVTDPTPITFESHMNWWRSRGRNEEYLLFCVNDVPVGITKFRPIDRVNRNVVLGADIHADHRGKGYAKHMWAKMLDHAFDNLGMWRASLITAEFNEKAIHIYRKLGFVEEGRHIDLLLREGKFHDAVCMYMLAKDWNGLLRV